VRIGFLTGRLPNKSVEPTGGSRSAQLPVMVQWRLASAAHSGRWAGGAAAKAHQPQRGDMFIVRPNRNLRKPRRGGMVLSRTGHVAPTGLAEKIGGRGGHYKHVAPTELPLWRASGS